MASPPDPEQRGEPEPRSSGPGQPPTLVEVRELLHHELHYTADGGGEYEQDLATECERIVRWLLNEYLRPIVSPDPTREGVAATDFNVRAHDLLTAIGYGLSLGWDLRTAFMGVKGDPTGRLALDRINELMGDAIPTGWTTEEAEPHA